MPGANPLETALRGFVPLSTDGPDGFAVGGVQSRSDPAWVRDRSGGATVTNIRRARHIAREFHGWDVVSEAALRDRAMRGE